MEAKLYRTKKPTGMKGKVEEHVTVGLDADTYRVISKVGENGEVLGRTTRTFQEGK